MIRKYLDLATAHLTYEDSQELEYAAQPASTDLPPMRVCNHDYGWIIFMNDQIPDPIPGFSDSFQALIRHARAEKCDLINFDRDAIPEDQFPSFDW